MIDTQAIRQRWASVGSKLDERGRRVFAAGEVRAAGWGGLEAVSEITGLARSTIGRGQKDLDAASLPKGRVRRKGGGRRHLWSRDATLIEDLRSIIEPATLGDPMRPLLWVSKSHDKVAVALHKKGHEISASSVKRLLPTLGYSRQSNRKADEGSKHPDRNAQFEHINARRSRHRPRGSPSLRRSANACKPHSRRLSWTCWTKATSTPVMRVRARDTFTYGSSAPRSPANRRSSATGWSMRRSTG